MVKKQKTLQGLTDNEKGVLIGLLMNHKKYKLVWEHTSETVGTELNFPEQYK